MAKSERYFSIDVEASGPIPGLWWMPSFAVCAVDNVQDNFKALLKPLDVCYPSIDSLIQDDVPGAMKVVAQGTPDFEWNEKKEDFENCDDLYDWYKLNGEHPKAVFQRFKTWLYKRGKKLGYRIYLVGAPAGFDALWIYWMYWFVMGEMPEFSFNSLDMRSYYMGMWGEKGLRTNKRRMKRRYSTGISHTHDPLDDAMGQAEIFQKMVEDRAKKTLVDLPPSTWKNY